MYKVLRTMSGINERSINVNQCSCGGKSSVRASELGRFWLVPVQNVLIHFVISALRGEGWFGFLFFAF